MTGASLYALLAAGLVLVALVFLVSGIRRMVGLKQNGEGGADDWYARQLRILWRADWSTAAALLVVALVAAMASAFGTGPLFVERSGNLAGGLLLVALTLFAAVLVTLIVRQRFVSRALVKADLRRQSRAFRSNDGS